MIPLTKYNFEKDTSANDQLYIFVDTETIEKPGVDSWSKREQILVVGYYEQWIFKEGQAFARYGSGFFYSQDQFFDDVVVPSVDDFEQEEIICVAHNWNFDAGVLQLGSPQHCRKYGYTIPMAQGIQYDPVKKGMMPFMLDLQFFRGFSEEDKPIVKNFRLLDSMNFFHMGLGVMMDSLGFPKEELPTHSYDELLSNREAIITAYKPRVVKDVQGLRMSMSELASFTYQHFGVLPKYTIGRLAYASFACSQQYFESVPRVSQVGHIGSSMASFNHKLKDPYLWPRNNGDDFVIDALSKSMRGGRTEAFFKGEPLKTWLYKYDVNSMYPDLMCGYVPIQVLHKTLKSAECNKITKQCRNRNDRTYLAHVDLLIPETEEYGAVGTVIKDKGLCFPVGKVIKQWVWKEEFEYFKAQGWIRKVREVHLYLAWPIFKKYVKHLYGLRKSFPKGSMMELICKMLLNSLYGKTGARAHGNWTVADDYVQQKYKDKTFNSTITEHNGWMEYLHRYSDGLWYVYMPAETVFDKKSVPSIACWVTAMGRLKLLKAFRLVKEHGGRVYYCDTDSMITDLSPGKMPVEIDSKKLGAWKYEGKSRGNRCWFFAPKHYCFDNKLTIKGVTTDALKGANKLQCVFEQERWSKFSTDIKGDMKRLAAGSCITRYRKFVLGINKKRNEPTTSGWTTPLLSNFNGLVG